MKKKLLSGLILAMLSLGFAAPSYADVWKKKVVHQATNEYDLHLTLQGKVDQSDEAYEKELLVFISDKAVKDGFPYFTFAIDATDPNVVIVHVQNFNQLPKDSKEMAVKYFAAKDILSLN